MKKTRSYGFVGDTVIKTKVVMCDGHRHSIHVHDHRGRINRFLNQDFVENLTFRKKSAKILKQNRKNFILNSSVTTSKIRDFV